MSGRLGNYLELVGEARKKRLEITRSQEKELRGLYEEIARELENSLKRYSPKTLTYRWLKDYSKTLRRESKTLHQTVKKKVSSSVLETAGAVTEAEQKFYAKAYPILSERFSHVFSSIPAQVAEELMSGGVYRGFSGLSERIWQYEKQFSRDIQTIISRGILAQKPAYDLAKDLETYLRPEAKKPWDWGKVYPGVSRQVDYSAQRLARTAVTHAYQLSLERATKDNPFVEGYRWHSSNAGRVCPLCQERDGQLYEKGSLPLDHPNGMCVVTAEISKSYEEIGRELGDWAAGRNQDPALDRWLNPKPDRDTITLTEDEEYALMDYLSSGSYKLNYPLRHGLSLDDEQIMLMRNLDSALNNLPVYQGTVYRSLDDTEIENVNAFLASYAVGSYQEFPAYLSTSTEIYDESMVIQYVIQSKTGRDIRFYNPNESEVLFPRNSGFFVTKVEGTTIYLREA